MCVGIVFSVYVAEVKIRETEISMEDFFYDFEINKNSTEYVFDITGAFDFTVTERTKLYYPKFQ